MSLRAIAKSYTENGITAYMHPRRPLRVFRVYEELRKLNPPAIDDTNWLEVLNDRFVLAECYLLDIEAHPEYPLALYLIEREGHGLARRFELFETLCGVDELNFILHAYENTRENSLPLDLPDDVTTEVEKKDTSLDGSETALKSNNEPSGVTNFGTANTSILVDAGA